MKRQALDQRHQTAIQEAEARGCGDLVRLFEAEAACSRAVIARSVHEVNRLATRDNELFASYYELIHAGVKVPTGEKWDKLRSATDVALFGDKNKEHIHFAALSLDGIGLDNYGECSLTARDDMIAHRASVFEENSVKFMEHHNIGLAKVNDLPKGFRAPWDDRGRLITAKLARSIDTTSRSGDFPQLLLKQGTTSDYDDFVEVNIWGPMTIRTFERVIVRRPKKQPPKSILRALKERLEKYSVSLQVI